MAKAQAMQTNGAGATPVVQAVPTAPRRGRPPKAQVVQNLADANAALAAQIGAAAPAQAAQAQAPATPPTPREAFEAAATKRMKAAIRSIRLVGRTASLGTFTDADIARMRAALEGALEGALARFHPGANQTGDFSFGD